MCYINILLICVILPISCSRLERSSEGQFSAKNGDSKVFWKEKQMYQTGNKALQSSKHRSVGILQKTDMDDAKKTEQCDDEFITKLSQLLNNFNISLDYKNIENLRTFIKVKTASRGRLSSLHFVAVLNTKQIYPEFGDEGTKRILETDDARSLTEPLFSTNLDKNAIENVKLAISIDNLMYANKSVIRVNVAIHFAHVQNEAEKIYTYLQEEESEKLNNFFRRRNKWKRKKLEVQKFSSLSIFFGSFLGLSSSILCGLSFALKKWSLVKMDKNKSYYLDKRWWMGHSLMMIGDVLHFMAFIFAPAIVVCTLQILTVIVTAVASSKILGEKLHKYGKLAFALSLGGCWVIVFHVPNEPHIYSIDTLLYMLCDQIFLIYIVILSIITVLLTSYWIPKYGHVNSLGYTIQSAIFGSIIVIGLKGVVLGYTDTLQHWLPWISLSVVAVFLMLQLECLNKALTIYNTLVVTTQYYVLYSACVILASSLLFKVWITSSHETIFTNFCGLFTIALGALILTIFEEGNATFDFSRLFAGPEIRQKQAIF